jgi:putative SOS response-associated peptidase YedK
MTTQQVAARLRRLQALAMGLRREHQRIGTGDDPAIGYRLINARADTVADKPAFRSAFKSRRCLVVADGFYEWKATGAKMKLPYRFTLKSHQPLAFAGLWERWDKGEEPVLTCTLITTGANDLVRGVHDRMPVIMPPADYGRWLDPNQHDNSAQAALLRPFPALEMAANPVGLRVNNPVLDDVACVEPVKLPPAD